MLPTHRKRAYAYASHNARKFSAALGKMLNTLHILAGALLIAIGIRGIEYITNKQVRQDTSQRHLLTVLKYFAMVAAVLFVLSTFIPSKQVGGSMQLEPVTQSAAIPSAQAKLPLLEDLQHDICRAVTPKPVPAILDP